METQVYNKEGKAVKKITLPESVFSQAWNADLVHQVVVSMEANARTPVAHTKNRGDVRGGGKKPWQQKGTGRARHGSIRSPLWRGGGVTFGPRNEKDYSKKVNKKVRTKALYMALSRKLKDGEVLFVDALTFGAPKTKDAKSVLEALSKVDGFGQLLSKKRNGALIAQSTKDTATEKSFSNFGNIEVDEVRNLNVRDVLAHKYLIIANPEEAIAFLEGKGRTVAQAETVTEAK